MKSINLLRTSFAPARLGLTILLAVCSAHATVVGNFATDGNGTTVTVSLTALIFGASPNLRVAASSLTYDGGIPLPVGTTGTILNIGAVPPSINNFMTFAPRPLNFILDGLGPGDLLDPHDCHTAVTNGESCSLLLPNGQVSPVVLTFDNNGTDATLNVFGRVTDDGGLTFSNWSGHLGATLTANLNAITTPAGLNVPPTPVNIFNYFTANPGGAIVTSHSDTFVATPVPEPGTTMSMGLGLVLASLVTRRITRLNRAK
jgi:hypothetical protein